METATLNRQGSDEQGTYGILTVKSHSFDSGELPWKNNESNMSCIPPGTYKCKVSHSEHFNRDLYHVLNVPGRTDVMIHPANFFGDTTLINPATGKKFKSDLLGCICLGTSEGTLDGQKAILGSKMAVTQFMTLLNNEDFTLIITDTNC